VHRARSRADIRRQARPHEHDAQAVETLLAGVGDGFVHGRRGPARATLHIVLMRAR
jgi:hypothetical protein